VREKLLRAWGVIQKSERIRKGFDRMNVHARAVSGGVRTGIGTVNLVRGIADDGPSESDLEDVAWTVASRGYAEAKAAYEEAMRPPQRKKRRKKANGDQG
jgi:hypothetical protein